jgi:hypothetical protein
MPTNWIKELATGWTLAGALIAGLTLVQPMANRDLPASADHGASRAAYRAASGERWVLQDGYAMGLREIAHVQRVFAPEDRGAAVP